MLAVTFKKQEMADLRREGFLQQSCIQKNTNIYIIYVQTLTFTRTWKSAVVIKHDYTHPSIIFHVEFSSSANKQF